MQRRGVSLLEVVFAIGAVSIGLLGVLALFPLALNQVGQGQACSGFGNTEIVIDISVVATALIQKRFGCASKHPSLQ